MVIIHWNERIGRNHLTHSHVIIITSPSLEILSVSRRIVHLKIMVINRSRGIHDRRARITALRSWFHVGE